MESKERIVAAIDLGDFACQRPARFGHQPYAVRNLADRPVFQSIARRISLCRRIDDVRIVGSNVPAHVLGSGLHNVRTNLLPTAHLCERLAVAADDTEADWVVYIPANRPFIDPKLIDQLLAATSDATSDYIGFHCDGGDHDRICDLGLVAEVFHVDALRRLRRISDRLPLCDNESAIGWLGEAPGAYHLKLIPLPKPLDRDDLRFAIRDEGDWERTQVLCRSVNLDNCQWRELCNLVSKNTDLRTAMELRNTSGVTLY